ncbi:PREDICTED: SPBc2 prophage-derived uncharacterized protein YonV-like [Habropoda laboriosa]|uniref:SPBc2 prophage-derived uncharacterized protein YonV-like n=1 Tax=Habropoda laboriosa TaxID=597456 RepID=UPI00083DC7BF|nr:PREDICTED: SPBc2 prophage-derived uncharacterized protein YonV-like [Habropoda laboriosa]
MFDNNVPNICWDGFSETDDLHLDFEKDDLSISDVVYDNSIINENPKVTVFDAVCGSGKTNHLIQKIKESDFNRKFLYIVPVIDECHRVAGTKYEEDDLFKRPILEENSKISYAYDNNHPLFNRKFKHPDYKGGNKEQNLKTLMNNKQNIVSTHQLFSKLTKDTLVNSKEYTLIIDETISVFQYYSGVTVKETRLLFKKKLLSVAEDGFTLVFNKENFGRDDSTTDGTKYEELARLCNARQLAVIDQSYVIWMLDIELIKSFKEVWVSTYMFQGSQMDSLFKKHKISYEIVNFGKSPKDFLKLINIHGVKDNSSFNSMIESRKNKLNLCGERWFSLSSSHFSKDGDSICENLRKNLGNFNRHVTKSPKKIFRFHTVFKDYDHKVSGKNYSNEWLPYNIKATNSYNQCHCLAYMLNLFVQPAITRLCHKMGYPISEEQFAVSELIQWIYRSRIRNGEVVDLYIPSARMRELLICWMNEWEFEKLDTFKRYD